MLRNALTDLANIATILALAVGAYAIIKPGVVSDYLQDIAASSADASDTLVTIDASASRTAQAVDALRDAIPDWLRPTMIDGDRSTAYFVMNTSLGGSGDFIGLSLVNEPNFAFRDVSATAWIGDRSLFALQGGVIPPREYLDIVEYGITLEDLSGEVEFCMTAFSVKEQRHFFEYRTVDI